ncbi:MAG: hypothetical protein ACI9YB_002839, partial [Halioglobus sp.]
SGKNETKRRKFAGIKDAYQFLLSDQKRIDKLKIQLKEKQERLARLAEAQEVDEASGSTVPPDQIIIEWG